jgi:hypothetical protein
MNLGKISAKLLANEFLEREVVFHNCRLSLAAFKDLNDYNEMRVELSPVKTVGILR